MNEEQDYKLTDLDYLIGDHHLQMMKAALPYMSLTEQKMISLFVKFNELKRTFHLFEDGETATLGICSAGERTASPVDMLNAIKPYGNTYEQDFIDLVMNFFQGFGLSRAYRETAPDMSAQGNKAEEAGGGSGGPFGRIPFEQLKNFLSPEQQSKIETMQLVMSAMQQMT